MAQWPLSFQLQQPPAETTPAPKWSHKLYRGPADQEVAVFYSKTVVDSEELARKFLDEKILGFDMEWTYPEVQKPRLQDQVGMIQLACEDKIALFHIGLHEGDTVEDLIPMDGTLRKILESPLISKVGVHCLGDFERLRKYFGLSPRGAFELSDLHLLITKTYLKLRLQKLASLVETYLGLPLDKDLAARKSPWTGELSDEQKHYAAADVYSGFMLYHCMDAKRTAMDIVAPLPIQADLYEGINERGYRRDGPLRVCSVKDPGGAGRGIQATDFFKHLSKVRVADDTRRPDSGRRALATSAQASLLADTKSTTTIKRPRMAEGDEEQAIPAKIQRVNNGGGVPGEEGGKGACP